MKRFLMLVGVFAVVGTPYVAAASGSQQSSVPTAKQFAALKKKVAGLQTALDVAASSPQALLQAVDPKCLIAATITFASGHHLPRTGGGGHLGLLPERMP